MGCPPGRSPPQRRIVCSPSTLQSRSGSEVLLIAPRHWDATMHKQHGQMMLDGTYYKEVEQGFIDQ